MVYLTSSVTSARSFASICHRRLADYALTCRYHQTSPESHVTQNTDCSMVTTDGRVTIRDTTLVVTSNGDAASGI